MKIILENIIWFRNNKEANWARSAPPSVTETQQIYNLSASMFLAPIFVIKLLAFYKNIEFINDIDSNFIYFTCIFSFSFEKNIVKTFLFEEKRKKLSWGDYLQE